MCIYRCARMHTYVSAWQALELIWLDENQIGDSGLRQLASALAEGEVRTATIL